MDKVTPLRSRPIHRPIGDSSEPVQTSEEAETGTMTVLEAAGGIINTGTVHGGQHLTSVKVAGHRAEGADGDI
ncbi:S-type pyocin domain-containing protein [Streptomyces sp. NPDC006798]|uniref:S-type pyocin domain-containing protein n=1 Tax=Streptomyces sp. NPDC006798 TaxID=3155462 RepID=UPI0033F3F66F